MCRLTSLSGVTVAAIIASVSCAPIDSPRRFRPDASSQSSSATAANDAVDASSERDAAARGGRDAAARAELHDAGAEHDAAPAHADSAADSGTRRPDAGRGENRDAGHIAEDTSDDDAGSSDDDAGNSPS